MTTKWKTVYPLKHADGSIDFRYVINKEYTGHKHPAYVLRFCGDYITSSLTLIGLDCSAYRHNYSRLNP